MGCDIHVAIEKRLEKNLTKNIWYPCNKFIVSKRDCLEGKEDPEIYLETTQIGFRNYNLFGKLAGVRSCEQPFVEPRGLPEDCQKYIREYYEKNKQDCIFHTPTWYSLKELIDFVDKMNISLSYKDFESDIDFKAYVEEERMLKRTCETFLNDIFDYLIENDFCIFDENSGLTKSQYIYKHYAEDFRIILWFDN